MPSHALVAWRTVRRARLDELLAVHQLAAAGGPGRAEQLDWALTLRLAAEFQGFARDLHNVATNIYATRLAGVRTVTREPLRLLMTTGRSIDRGNAHPGALGGDFARLGLALWPALEATDSRTPSWNAALTELNAARNAVAHDNPAELEDLTRRDSGPTLTSFQRWRPALDALAVTMDNVVGSFVETTLGPPHPW
jgi:hypothetical protein